MSTESADADSGRRTPTPERRPPHRVSCGAEVLSPAKRRKQVYAESPAQKVLELEKARGELVSTARCPSRGDCDRYGNLWLPTFSYLTARDIVDCAAPCCKLWKEVAHSKELWVGLRSHLQLVDQLLVLEKLLERLSKGRLFKCRRLGTGESVLLRAVDLERTNAGSNDGMPTHFLREVALLSELRHPNIIRCFGAEILDKRAVMCTEFVHESFAMWHKRLASFSRLERAMDIRCKFRQVLTGLSFVHNQGVMHRNLKPDNIFVNEQGIVKIGDFTSTRMLDIPFQAYTPEDPKERAISGRQIRKLWYRAPELILRDEIYGPKVDVWSVGCLLAEAASGQPLFSSESEIDHLFRVFRLLGTPTPASWPEAMTMSNFSPAFPIYVGFSLRRVARAQHFDNVAEKERLLQEAGQDRSGILHNLFSVSSVLGPTGMLALDRMISMVPSSRASCQESLESPFFAQVTSSPTFQNLHAMAHRWINELPADPVDSAERLQSELHQQDIQQAGQTEVVNASRDIDCPPMPAPSTNIPSQTVWNILNVMWQREQTGHADASSAPTKASLLRLPVGMDAELRAVSVDFLVGLASMLQLKDHTVHLACAISDKYFSLQEAPLSQDRLNLVAATCLKVSDVFAEQSREYYKQETTADYVQALLQQMNAEQILLCEKEILLALNFKLNQPTIHWFLQCYLAYGRFTRLGRVGKTASFISDLMLLDFELLAYTPSLKAQCALLLAVFFVQQGAKSSVGETEPVISTYLRHWDRSVRSRVCRCNTVVEASMCLQGVVKTLVEKRRKWKSQGLGAVESRHVTHVRQLVYPDRFPVSELVQYILPDRLRAMTAP